MTTSTAPERDAPPPPAPGRARSRWFRSKDEVAWLVMLALAVRALAAWVNPSILNDSVTLLQSSERFAREGTAAALHVRDHPLTPWLVSLAPAGLDLELVATVLCVVAGAIAVWPLHVIVRRTAGRHAATAACIVYAAIPKIVGVASVPMTSAVFLPLFLSGISLALVSSAPSPRPSAARRRRAPAWLRRRTHAWFVFRRRHGARARRIVRLAGSGAMCGLAYFCRPEGLIAAAGAALAALLVPRRGRRLASAAIVVAAFVVVAAPYVTALSRDAGRFVVSPKKDVGRFLGATDAPSPPLDTGAAVGAAAEGLQAALTAPIFVLALVGLFSPKRWRERRSRAARLAVLGLAAALLAAVVRLRTGWGYGGARHALPAALLLLPFAGEGFLFVGSFISRVIARRRLAVVLASYYAVACAVNAVLRPEGEDLADARRLGEAVADEARARGTKDVVVATFAKPLVAYYADRSLRGTGGSAADLPLWGRFHGLLERPDAEADRARLVAAVRDGHAQWLVLDLFRATTNPTGETGIRGRELAKRLEDDGALGGRVLSPGSPLTAFPVR